MLNWLSQIASVTLFNLRSIPERKGSALTAAVGIAGVVAVFVGVLSIAEGFKAAMRVSGADDVAIVLRSSADSEMTSGLSREQARLIADAPGVARTADGPLTSAELFVMINLPKRSTGTDANVPLRGVEKAAMTVRGDIKIVEGRKFEPGRNEVIVGAGAARAFAGLEMGRKIRIGQNEWEVVGLFSGGGGAAESETALLIMTFLAVQVRCGQTDQSPQKSGGEWIEELDRGSVGVDSAMRRRASGVWASPEL